MLAQLAEFWRAHRDYAAIFHFAYLKATYPGALTSGNVRDVQNLRVDPYFEDYVREALKPLGVYVNLCRATLQWRPRRFSVSLVTDVIASSADRSRYTWDRRHRTL